MKEKLQEYALIAEVISAVCIVVSLLFVGLQVQLGAEETAANSEAIRSSVRQSMMNADKDILLYLTENPKLLQPDSLEGEDAEKVIPLLQVLLRTRENYWTEYQNGLLDKETYDSYMFPMIYLMSNSKNIQELWAVLKVGNGSFLQGFKSDIDLRLIAFNEQSIE